MTTTAIDVTKRRGPTTRFEKTLNVFSLRLTLAQRDALARASQRLDISRGDVICELIEQYAHIMAKATAGPKTRARSDTTKK